jgi:hypothetical protein
MRQFTSNYQLAGGKAAFSGPSLFGVGEHPL